MIRLYTVDNNHKDYEANEDIKCEELIEKHKQTIQEKMRTIGEWKLLYLETPQLVQGKINA